MLEALIVFLPLAGAVLAGLLSRPLGDRGAQMVTSGALVLAAFLSVVVFVDVALGGNARTTVLFTWFDSGTFELNWALRVDTLSAVMFCVVTIVSAVVHVYSIGYMSEDKSIPRFMAYLSLFTFFMLMLVSADNLVQLFFGWEGVGLASYLLIGFWYEKPSANAAAMKAFLVNRVGDVGFALGIAGLFFLFGSVEFDQIFAQVAEEEGAILNVFGVEAHALTAIALLLFVGAMGKSAQLGLHTWLPDAMEGPTPVSALIHAATMVTAGVFLVCRMSPVFEFAPDALAAVTAIGGLTAFFAATVGLTQTDIKRVIAYSTCSQLGYMFFAAGVSAYGAAMFHLMTHAFFKALLFLGAGAVIHAMHHEQDMFKMGGLYKKIPITYVLMWIGSLALAGFGIPGLGIGFAGFYSKDIVLEAAWAAHSGVGHFAFWLGVAAALMTAFYSFRLIFLVFHGQSRGDAHTFDHAHEAPRVMIWPLYPLAVGAIAAGVLFYPLFVGDAREAFWNGSIFALHDIIEEAHHVPFWVKSIPMVVSVLGLGLAYVMYIARPGLPALAARTFRPLYMFSYRKWYFDELYDRIFVRPAWYLGEGLWKSGDGAVIDGVGPNGVAALTRNLARVASRLQSGYVYHYAFAMLIGVVGLITWYIVTTLG
jgi:NADH-quinone oxidoreductase subunit L